MSPLTCLSSSDFPQEVKGRNREEDVTCVLEVIYDAVFIPKLNKDAKMYIKKLSKSIFEISIHKQQNRDSKSSPNCHDLAKWLSHYLYFFSFLFLFFYLGLTTQREVRESITSQVSHSHGHMTGSHSVTSHDVT